MEWFQHNTDAYFDAKVKKLILKHGAYGYAVYFHCLELIAKDYSQDNKGFELKHSSEDIAHNLNIPCKKIVDNILETIVNLGLFQGKSFSCPKLEKYVNTPKSTKECK